MGRTTLIVTTAAAAIAIVIAGLTGSTAFLAAFTGGLLGFGLVVAVKQYRAAKADAAIRARYGLTPWLGDPYLEDARGGRR